MAKRRRQRPQTERIYPVTNRPPTAHQRRKNLPPPSRRGISPLWLALGAVAAIAIVAVVGYATFFAPGAGPGATASPGRSLDAGGLHPPSATPLASPPSAPAGDGTTATIETELGTIVMEIYTESAPVASENFINLAEAGFYDGIGFHRLVPDFMIPGGAPEGTGRGGPPYRIQDEPVVGEYTRGTVAMARSSQPNSQGSQFFIVVKDSLFLAGGGYSIFGRATAGMEVVDQIVLMPTANDDPGGRGGSALDPVIMESVTIQRPT